MKVYALLEIETKDGNEPTTEIGGVYSTYRNAAERLLRKKYKAYPIYVFRKPNEYEVDYFKRDGLFEYTAEIYEYEVDEY